MITCTINVRDNATPALEAFMKRFSPEQLAKLCAPKLQDMWSHHLTSLPKNRGGYPSTRFWQDAAHKVRGVPMGGNVLLTCDKQGVRQRWLGGQILKGGKGPKMLTIPICAEAYGTIAADWGDQLVLVCIGAKRFLCLYLGSTEVESRYKKFLGSPFEKAAAKKKNPWRRAETTAKHARDFAHFAQRKPDVIFLHKGGGAMFDAKFISLAQLHFSLKFMFVLKDTVMQGPNPNVVPMDKLMETTKQTIIDAAQNN